MGIDKLDVHDGLLFGSDRGWSCLEITDAMRREALRIRLTGCISDDSVHSLILSPEQDSLCKEEMSLAEVSSEGLRQWNMNMDVEYQYETFNGLPVYYGGDMLIRRMRRMILWRGRARRMWTTIILMFRREWN